MVSHSETVKEGDLIDGDGLEMISPDADPPPPSGIKEAWSSLVEDPSVFIRHWNYKGAILSGVFRAPIFLFSYLIGHQSVKLAIGAASLQFTFRFLFAGISGALIQAFRRVEPPWKALISILMIVPVISHLFEYFLQVGFGYFTGTANQTDSAIMRSICMSIMSALFTLFAMRRNVMIVGEKESRSLLSDILSLPRLVFEFLAFVPNEIALTIHRKKYVLALLGFIGFAVFSQLMCWAFTNKFSWTFGGGRSLPFLNYWAADGIVLLALATTLSLFFSSYVRDNK